MTGERTGKAREKPAAKTAENGGEAAVPERRQFPGRKEPTPEEIREAREDAQRLRALAEYGMSASMIGKVVKLPVKAIEIAIAEGANDPPSSGVPAGATADPPAPTVPPGAMSGEAPRGTNPATAAACSDPVEFPDEPQREDPLAGPAFFDEPPIVLYKLLKQGGIHDAKARLIARRYRHSPPSDFDRLRSTMLAASIPAQSTDFLISAFKEELGIATPAVEASAPSSPSSLYEQIRRDDEAQLQREYMLARIQAIRLGQGNNAGSASNPEAERLRAEVASLTREREQRVLLDSIDAKLGPLRADLEQLKNRPEARVPSFDEVDRGKAARAAEVQAAALAKGVDVLGRKLESTGSLQQVFRSVVSASSPELTRASVDVVRSTVSAFRDGTGARGPSPPVPQPGEQDLAVAAELLRHVRGGGP
ncbi:MAG TPA: hypothetical protein VGU43_07475 [Thermoplasmata archaeon]|nr:hypothetical protein [Thermoplasmata archaeon]